MPPTPEMFHQLGVALLLGLLVGLQREKTAPGHPGMRTFPLITLLGTVCALLAKPFGGWIVAAGLAALAVVLILSQQNGRSEKDERHGSTTEVAVLIMFCVGALLTVAPMTVAIAMGGGVAVLLQFKPELHRFAEQLGNDDLRAIMQFVVITCIILPVLPQETIDPFGVLSPFNAWLMVVMVVGLGLIGYIGYKFLGRDAGILLGGLLGGMISSTATTLSYARQAKADRSYGPSATVVIMIASTVAFARVLAIMAIVAPEFAYHAMVPFIALLVLTAVPSLVLWIFLRRQPSEMALHGNPTELKSAIVFAGIYALVLVGLAAGRSYFGEQGMFAVATLSGLTDLDAITLSTARLSLQDSDVFQTGWQLVVAAALANLAAKAVLAGAIGGWRLFLRLTLLFAIPFVGGIVLLVLWA